MSPVGVRVEDEGFFVCSAFSVAGSISTKAYLEVTAMADEPPPIITVGPANQTLPINTLAILPCQASGSPAPTVSWMKNVEPISGLQYDPRITISDPGSLKIESNKRNVLNEMSLSPFSQFIYLYCLASPHCLKRSSQTKTSVNFSLFRVRRPGQSL